MLGYPQTPPPRGASRLTARPADPQGLGQPGGGGGMCEDKGERKGWSRKGLGQVFKHVRRRQIRILLTPIVAKFSSACTPHEQYYQGHWGGDLRTGRKKGCCTSSCGSMMGLPQ